MNPMENAEVISVYTREQAIADGVLADVTDHPAVSKYIRKARVCLTDHLWNELRGGEVAAEYDLRLHDVIMLGVVALRQEFHKKPDELLGPVAFKVFFNGNDRTLWACWNEVEGFTFMFPEDY